MDTSFKTTKCEMNAVQWDGSVEAAKAIGTLGLRQVKWDHTRNAFTFFAEREYRVTLSDWVVRDEDDRFYVIHHPLFIQLFRPKTTKA